MSIPPAGPATVRRPPTARTRRALSTRRQAAVAALLAALIATLLGCNLPRGDAVLDADDGGLAPLTDFEDVRAVDGFPSIAFQNSYEAALRSLQQRPRPAAGRRSLAILVLSSGGVNGAFGAGILHGWSRRGDRPEFDIVTGVSVGALLAPFAFAGPRFDDRIERMFRYLRPSDLHSSKGAIAAAIWEESRLDNAPLQERIERGVDEELLAAVAERHAAGGRCWVGTTDLDNGRFVIWDLGAIAQRGTPEALQLFRAVLTASAAMPVFYPPVRFALGEREEMHVDGAVIRPLFVPQNCIDTTRAAERTGWDWDAVDTTVFVVHNGSLRPLPMEIPRDTMAIAVRTVTMMSYTMVTEHVLHLYLLARALGASFAFVTLPDGLDLSIDSFSAEDTDKLFLLGQGMMQRREAWASSPPGYVLRADLERAEAIAPEPLDDRALATRMDRLERALQALTGQIQALRER